MISTWSVGAWYLEKIWILPDTHMHTCVLASKQNTRTSTSKTCIHKHTHPPSHANVHTCPCTHTRANKHMHTTVHTHIVIMLTYALHNCTRIHSMHIFSLHTHANILYMILPFLYKFLKNECVVSKRQWPHVNVIKFTFFLSTLSSRTPFATQ